MKNLNLNFRLIKGRRHYLIMEDKTAIEIIPYNKTEALFGPFDGKIAYPYRYFENDFRLVMENNDSKIESYMLLDMAFGWFWQYLWNNEPTS